MQGQPLMINYRCEFETHTEKCERWGDVVLHEEWHYAKSVRWLCEEHAGMVAAATTTIVAGKAMTLHSAKCGPTR